MKKKLLVYEKEKIEEFICKVESEKGKVFPVSYLMDKNVNLKYNGINDEECFVLDITALVMSLSERKGLQLIYESWINALNEEASIQCSVRWSVHLPYREWQWLYCLWLRWLVQIYL